VTSTADVTHVDPGALIIRATGLRKRYGEVEAVRGVSFEVRRGDIYGFLGPNGSGKSTTIAMLLGLVQPNDGQIDLFGLGPEHQALGLSRVGAIIEIPAFYPYLSGRDNLRAISHLHGDIPDERIDEVLHTVGLADAGRKHFGNYSLGMKQRIGIAGALLHDPELLVLDEPTNGLDPAGMLEVRHLLLRLAEIGKTIFISSHLLTELEHLCDRVAIIKQGEVVAEGDLSALIHRDRTILVTTDTPEKAALMARQVAGVTQVERTETGLIITAPDVDPAEINTALVRSGVAVRELRLGGSSLEEVFLELTGSETDQAA
jgi:ABC-2 type transport system ATP-binding protein